MQAILLAAGLGTRLRPYTFNRPKPLFPVLNKPLLHILLDILEKADCKRIVVNGHHLGDQIEQTVAGRSRVHFQFEPEILGTGGSLREALPQFTDDPILVMNGDIFHTIDVVALYKHHVQSENKITLAMHDYPRFNMVGVREDAVYSFRVSSERHQENALAFTGIHVVDPSIIELIPREGYYHIIDLYEELIQKGEKIGCYRIDGSIWHDIGTVEDYLKLHGELLSGKQKHGLIMDSTQEPWMINSDAKIGNNVHLEGWGCIGKSIIGKGAHLCNCVVWDNAVVPEGANLENILVASDQENI